MKIEKAGYFWIWILPLSPNLIWCGYSVLICSLLACWLLNITYQMTELEIVINIKSCSPVKFAFCIILNHQIWFLIEKVIIQILKCIQPESESELLLSSVDLLSIHLSLWILNFSFTSDDLSVYPQWTNRVFF